MRHKLLIFVLALALSSCWFGYSQTVTNAAAETNLSQISWTLNSDWKDTKVTLYQATGGTVQLNAKEAVITEYEGRENGRFLYTNDWVITAFVDPETGSAWLGFVPTFHTSPAQPLTYFYLETKSGIVCGNVSFSEAYLNAIPAGLHDVINPGKIAWGDIRWFDSVVPNVKRGENLDTVIKQFNENGGLNGGLRWVLKARGHGQVTIIQNSMQHVENGLNPWLFVYAQNGSRFTETTIEAIDVEDENLRLDLKGPDGVHESGSSGVHTASVWIDLKTWKVVKAIQDNKP
jgi:hypothetical protein